MKLNLVKIFQAIIFFSSSIIYAQTDCINTELTINMFDSFEDGGGSVTLAGVTATNSGASSATAVCVDTSVCNTVVFAETDDWSYENSWTITDADGAVLASGDNANGTLGGCVTACGDETAENYNSAADISDYSLCEFAGCTDSTAFNYGDFAVADDSSCVDFTEGCTDLIAENYDGNSNTDDGSCEYISGCIDYNACNFNEAATNDDDSCEYLAGDEQLNCNLTCEFSEAVHVGGGTSQDDLYWVISDCNNEVIGEGEAPFSGCLYLSDSYTINMYSWNSDIMYDYTDMDDGMMYDDSQMDSMFIDFPPMDGSMSEDFQNEDNIGSGNQDGENQESIDQGMISQSGDSSNVHSMFINDNEYKLFHGSDTAYYLGCSYVQTEGTDFLSEFNWIITDCEGTELLSGGSFFASSIDLPENYNIFLFDSSEDSQSTNVLKVNNESYVIEDGLSASFKIGCTADLSFGCVSENACNFDSLADVNDFSCDFIRNDSTLNCNIPCETGTVIHVGGGYYQEEVSWSISDCYGELVAQGGAPFSECVDISERFTLIMNDSYGDGWNENFIYINEQEFYTLDTGTNDTVFTCSLGCISDQALNYDSLALDSTLCYFSGCTDPIALNFNPIANVTNDPICEYSVQGCMYSWAFNFDSLANEDDGSCYEFIYGCTDTLAYNFNNINTTEYSDNLTGDTSIDINTNDGSCLYNVGCTDTTMFNFCSSCVISDDASCVPYIYGCQDSTAYNYNSSANSPFINGEECYEIIEGCLDTLAFNFNNSNGSLTGDVHSDVNTNIESLCLPFIDGCMDDNAFNYNLLANVQVDSTCIPVIFGCTNPIYLEYLTNEAEFNTHNQELCLNYLIIGCSDVQAVNYDSMVNYPIDNDDYCMYSVIEGCTDPNKFNFNPQALQDDGSCEDIIFGCIYEWALNYDTIANTDDQSCIIKYFGCMDSTAFNYSALANLDQVSSSDLSSPCIVITEGCTDELAFNFDSDANTDDASCVPSIYGCQDSTAYNYNSSANSPFINGEECYEIIEGCLDTLAFNFNNSNGPLTGDVHSDVNTNIGSLCVPYIYGCTDESMSNYNPIANINETSEVDPTIPCMIIFEGCTDLNYLEYWVYNSDSLSISMPNSIPNLDDGTCLTQIIYGCTDDSSKNFNSSANISDASCVPYIYGCMDESYLDFNSEANTEISCVSLIVLGCTNEDANNYNPNANIDNNSCYNLDELTINAADYEYSMLVTARIMINDGYSQNPAHSVIMFNNGSLAGFASLDSLPNNQWYAFITVFSNSVEDTIDVQLLLDQESLGYSMSLAFESYTMLGSIDNPIIFALENQTNSVCMNTDADNYLEYGECVVFGCDDQSALNFDSQVTQDNESCIYTGCTSIYYIQYNPLATIDDGSCSVTWQQAYEDQSELITSLQIQIADNSNDNNISQNELDSPLSASETDLATAVETITSLESDLILANDSISSLDSALSTIETDLSTANATITSLNNQLADYSINNNTLQNEYEDLLITIQFNEVVIGVLNDLNQGIETTNNSLQQLNEGLQDDITGLDLSLSNIQTDLDIANGTISSLESDLISSADSISSLGSALSTSQTDLGIAVDSAYIEGYAAGIISLEGQQIMTEVDAFLLMPEGWSFFGFTCIDSLDVAEAFYQVNDQILIVKNNDGNVYLPEFGFNGIGNLIYGLGYQIKLTEAIDDFQFCPQILPSSD